MSVRSLIRKTVIEDAVVYGLIEDRFYPAQLASVKNPEFPCACFAFVGGNPDRDVPNFGFLTFNIWVWSSESFEQAYEIYGAVKASLNLKRLKDEEVSFVSNEVAKPIENYDVVTGDYYLMAGWRVREIEV